MKSSEVRKKFLDFFQKNQHKIISGADLIRNNDPSLLFVNAGMNQFKEVFLGLKIPPAKNTATIQNCLRVGGKHNDLEEVGATPLHHTFFEMLGNFSFGGYFKEKAIELSWKFLTEELKIPSEHLWASVHHEDEESYKIWKKRVPESKIYKLGDKDNFWQMGETGPCGYCSEIHYYKGKSKSPDPNQLLEIWNLVFMEFQLQRDGKREKLPVPCVDTGMGLERLCAVLQNKTNNYHTDLFKGVIQEIEKHCNFKYAFDENQTEENPPNEIQKAFRVAADHSRAVSLLIAEGARPGNQKESYVLRRLIRRALYYSQKLQPKTNLLEVGAKKAIALMEEAAQDLGKSFKEYERHFDFLKSDKQLVLRNIQSEDQRFSSSLKEGEKRLEEVMQKNRQMKIDKETVWNLYSTYGFPMDLTRLMAKERGWEMPTEEEMEKYIDSLSQQAEQTAANKITENESALFSFMYSALETKERVTDWTAYKSNKETAKILKTCYIPRIQEKPHLDLPSISTDPLPKGSEGWLALDKSCFYPEGGGPMGDKGWIKTETGKALVLDCKKYEKMIAHKVKVLKGELSAGQTAEIKVDKDFRQQMAISHSSTHLLNSALRSVLGDSVCQAGSLVEPGRLRFDFTFSRPLTKKELYQIEERIYQSIERKDSVHSSYKSLSQAKAEGALYLKGEDYGQDQVRVIRMGEKTSLELCGGIHVQNTEEIRSFKIVSEKGVQSGVRRISAYTGALALEWESHLLRENRELRKYLDLPAIETIKKEAYFWKGSIEKQNPFLCWLENKTDQIKTLKKSIVRLEEQKKENPQTLDQIQIKRRFQPLAEQTLELRNEMSLPLSKEKDKFWEKKIELNSFKEKSLSKVKEPSLSQSNSSISTDFFEDFFEESTTENTTKSHKTNSIPAPPLLEKFELKKRELEKLEAQWEEIKEKGLRKDELLHKAKDFEIKGLKGKLLIAEFPIEDRKILSDLSDSLLAVLSSGLLLIAGRGDSKHPVALSLTKDFQKFLSAGNILKTIVAPLCKGQGGGKTGFAQGSISDRPAFSKLEETLLEKIKQSVLSGA